MEWSARSFLVGMPHMVPEQLSEVELLKALGDAQWQSISAMLQTPSATIVNDHGERLYASFINIDLSFGAKTARDFGEGAEVHVRHASRFYARRFVEGFFSFDTAAVPPAHTAAVTSRDEIESLGTPSVYLTNAFVTREESNLRLRTFAPAGDVGKELSTDVLPPGIQDHEAVERSGTLALPGMERATVLATKDDDEVVYEIVPESDLNGAGLLYFARYVAIANFAARVFLQRRARTPFSSALIRLLATKRRRIFYFANANEGDAIKIHVTAFAARTGENAPPASTTHTPFKLYFVTEMRRQSDGTLMAISAAEKHLIIGKRLKSLTLEAARIDRQLAL